MILLNKNQLQDIKLNRRWETHKYGNIGDVSDEILRLIAAREGFNRFFDFGAIKEDELMRCSVCINIE